MRNTLPSLARMRARRLNPRIPSAPRAYVEALAAGERRSEGLGRAFEQASTLLGSALAGGIGSSLLVMLADVGKGPFAGIVAGALAATAVEIRKSHLRTRNAEGFDGPACQALLRMVRDRLDVGVTATRRASAWVVFDTPVSEPRVLGEREYERFRRTVPMLNEVAVDGPHLVVNRLRHGRLDGSHTAAPAIVEYEIGTGRVVGEAWYVDGRPATREATFAAYEEYRVDNPAGPYERERYGSSRIDEADERRRREAGEGADPDEPGLPAYGR